MKEVLTPTQEQYTNERFAEVFTSYKQYIPFKMRIVIVLIFYNDDVDISSSLHDSLKFGIHF